MTLSGASSPSGRSILAAALLLVLPLSSASGQSVSGDTQAWAAVIASGPAHDDSRVLVWFDGHARWRDDAGDLGVTIVRPAIGWRVSRRLDLWAGYATVVSRTPGSGRVAEDRLWQQATYPLPALLGGGLSGRTRLEQRFRASSGDTGWRLRQFVRWERRVGQRALSPVVWNELFVGINDAAWGQESGFDQNRLFVGAAWRATASARLEVGYLNNRLDAASGDRTNHNLSATLFYAF